MERAKSVTKLFGVILIGLFTIGWYFPGKDTTNKVVTDRVEMSYKEAIAIDKTYTVDKGHMWKDVTYYLQRERTGIPFVYKRDTLKATVVFYVVQ